MRKFLSILIISLIACSALSAAENLFSFSAGLSSGVPFYGSNSAISTGSEIEKVNPIKHASLYIGNDNVWDITWSAQEKSSKLHVSFPVGIKVYPGLGGLNAGLAYTLGFRNDIINTNAAGEYNGTTPWGNGFKFQLEYNFAHEGSSRYLPSIGGYWNLMPRGNDSYDNLIVLYISANF